MNKLCLIQCQMHNKAMQELYFSLVLHPTVPLKLNADTPESDTEVLILT